MGTCNSVSACITTKLTSICTSTSTRTRISGSTCTGPIGTRSGIGTGVFKFTIFLLLITKTG